jgi:16S rRNA (cytosine1402-N4)-methyltransferase
MEHKPVLLQEVLEYLSPKKNQNYVDCTVGFGGHAEKILEKTAPTGVLIGIDQDKDTLEAAERYLDRFKGRFQPRWGNFTELAKVTAGIPINGGIIADLGVSSKQLDETERGFSFAKEAPLDMRMNRASGLTAYKVVNEYSSERLTEILRKYGDEKFAKKIAENIVLARELKGIEKTTELADVVRNSIPRRFWPRRIDPATRTFQAIRIEVNDELHKLEQFLPLTVEVLKPGARLAVITFHSREDKIVKSFLRHEENPCECPPEFPECRCGIKPTLKIINRKAITASEEEIETNPRSRSARLRIAEKI